jgi:hypothetical protein
MEVQQMKEHLLTRMEANATEMKEMNANMKSNKEQMMAKMEANRKVDWEERRAKKKADQENLKRMMAEMMTANQAKTDVKLKELTETAEKTRLEREEPISADMKACHEVTEADIEKIEPNPGMMQSAGEHQEVPKREVAVMVIGGLRKWHMDRIQAAECSQKLKEETQGYCGTQRRATIAGRRVTHCEGVAWLRRSVVRKDCTRAKVG